MRLRICLDRRCVRQWQVSLLHRLTRLPGVAIDVDATFGRTALPQGAELLFQLESLLYGLPRNGPAARVSQAALAHFIGSVQPPDLTLDLCGDAPNDNGRVWRLTFDGAPGETALLAILLEGRVPHAALVEGDIVIATARLGTEYGGIALASFEDTLVRASTLIVAAVKGGTSHVLPALPFESAGCPAPTQPTTMQLGKAAAKQVARRIAQQLHRLCFNTPHWRVGWRRLDGLDLFDLRRHPGTGWRTIPDDGHRFYADPFPVVHGGAVTLFVEDYEYRLGKGVISAVQFGADGPSGQPRPVLEQPGHLSYPFVFEKEGQIWMVPESCSSGTVDLYRATAFPGGWIKEATLLSDVIASDPTLVEYAGTWWLFATVRDGGGSFSDALFLWSAPDFRGPWTPHPRNPVLIDIASARPAGRMVDRNNALLRPVQDCRRRYGAALGIARVTRLDLDGFEQEIEALIGPGPDWPGSRLHTLNSAGGLEFIDGSGWSPRWGRRPMT